MTTATAEKQITQQDIERLRVEIAGLKWRVREREQQIEMSLQFHQLSQEREDLMERLAALNADA